MKVTVNGGTPFVLAKGKPITISVEVDPTGEELPWVDINVTGGQLQVYGQHVNRTGNIILHLFGDKFNADEEIG